MKRRRGGAKSTSRSPEMPKQATSPETRLRRSSTRGASLTPSKPAARRQPTEALHMTTRAAGKAASTVGTDSPSVSEASGSRRSSLNDTATHPQHDAKLNHNHLAPSTTQPSESASADGQDEQDRDADHDQMDADMPAAPESDTSSQDQSLDTSKSGNKRKRSSAGTEDLTPHPPQTNGANSSSSPEEPDPPLPPTTNHQDPEPPRKRARGGWRGRGRGRGRGGRGGLTLSSHASFQTDATTTPPSAGLQDRGHLSDDQQAGSGGLGKQPKRLPGRRRAPNADPSVEADLRRQLQLKTAYRAVVKVLKPVLAELADRTINDVEDDPMAHEQSDQHEIVKNALDAKLADRVGYLDRKLAISKEHVERRKTAELQIAETAYNNVFFNLQEDYLLRCQYEILNILREAEKQAQDGYATDDEDGLVPRRRGMQYKWRSTGFLDPKSDSRSRFYIETDKLWKDHQLRGFSRKERDGFLEKYSDEFDKEAATSRGNFATFDADRREYALAVYNANALAEAAEAVEQGLKPPPVIKTLPNEDAAGLQLLVSAIENPPPPAPLPSRVEEHKYEERITPRSTPAAEISTPTMGSTAARSTSTPKSARGRRGRGQSARSTPIRANGRSRTSTPAPVVFDDSFEPPEPGSAMSASMPTRAETRDPSPRKTMVEPTPAAYIPEGPRPAVPEGPIINGAGGESMAEPQMPRQPSVSSNRITDLLNKGDEPPPPIASFISSSPAALPPAILQPLPQPLTTPSAPPSELPRFAAHSGQPSDSSSQPGLPAQLSQPVDRSERESYFSTHSEPDRTFDAIGTAQPRPTTAPTEATRQDAPPARKTFWDTITIDNKSRPTSPLNADKTPLARIRQILNPSNFPRRTDSPPGTTLPATATGSNDRLSERPEMAPPASRASISNDASSRRSSGAASVVSQPPNAQPAAASPVEAPKRSNSRDKGLEQRQNRWRAAVPPQHGPTPPFRPDSNPPHNAFLKHQGWTVESQMRLSQQSATSPPQSYPTFAPPYDARAQPPAGYAPPGHPVPPPPLLGPYTQSYPPLNPNLSAMQFVSPPFNCPPGPPPYQSIYAPPPQGYPPPPPSTYGVPPPPPPPPHQHQQQPGPPPGPPGPPHQQQQHYGTQYGGQPILPATIDRRSSGGQAGGQAGSPYPGSPPAHHPPAFSQQQSQYGAGNAGGQSERGGRGGHGGRRRWKNTAPGTEFRPYTGPKRH